MKRETELLHLADASAQWGGAINTPVVHASLFCFESLQEYIDTGAGKLSHYSYGRVANPTVEVLEKKIAFLEGTDEAMALASGMAAISTAFLAFVEAGDHLLVSRSAYGPVHGLCEGMLARMGVETEYFEASETLDIVPRLRANTRLIYLESPGSITFDILDLCAVARVARAHGVLTMIDNTWATPLYQNPIDLGIDLVLHSGTKYIGGHSDLIMGLIAGPKELMAKIRPVGINLGGTLSPDEAYLATRGLRTLAVRMARHQDSALQIAQWLEEQPNVLRVMHPGLRSFPGHEIAARQMQGYSGLFGFQLVPRSPQAQERFVNSLLSLFRLGCSWGGYESLILPTMGLTSHTYRVSIGLEAPEDLIDVMHAALHAYVTED